MRTRDLRLVPSAAVGWGVLLVLAGQPAAVALWVAGVAAAAVVLVVLVGPVRAALRQAAGQVVLVSLVVAVLATAVAGQLLAAGAGPLPELVAAEASGSVVGTVVSEPREVSGGFGGEARYVLTVRATEVEGRLRTTSGGADGTHGPVHAPAHGDVVVLGGPELREPSYGATVRVTGRLRAVDPGTADVAMLLLATSTPDDPSLAVVAPPPDHLRAVGAIRSSFAEVARGLSAQARGLVPGIAVGDTSQLSSALDADMKTTSLTHITAVSGSHFAIIFTVVTAASTALRLPRRSRAAVSAAVMTGFVLLVHPEPSVLRAALMAAVVLLALLLGRASQALPALSAAVLVLLAVDPFLARSYGFALSVLATAGLVLGTAPIAHRLETWLPRWLALAVAVPVAAQLACTPVVVLLDPSVPLYSVPANLLAAPALVPATILGVVGALCAPVLPGVSRVLAEVAGWSTWWIAEVAQRFAAAPGARVPWVAGGWGAVLLAVVTTAGVLLVVGRARIVWAVRTSLYALGLGRPPSAPRRGGRLRGALTAAGTHAPARSGPVHAAWHPLRRPFRAALVVVLCVLVLWVGRPPWLPPLLGGRPGGAHADGWEIALCDVGQGDALVVRTADDRALMIDTGPADGGAGACLDELGVTALDLLVLTHFHADHVGGLSDVLAGRAVDAVLVSPVRDPPAQAAAVVAELDDAGVPWEVAEVGQETTPVLRADPARSDSAKSDPARSDPARSDPARSDPASSDAARSDAATSRTGDVTWQVVAPQPADVPATPDGGANDGSVVLLVQTPSFTLVALGDLESAGQAAVLATLRAAGVGPVDVVKVAHHGSRTQDRRLAELLSPAVALVGVGADNTYGHPTQTALDLYRGVGAAVLRTDECGTVGLLSRDGQTLVTGSCS